MSNKPPPQPVEPWPNVRKIIGPDPTAGLVLVFDQIDEFKRKERRKFTEMLAAIAAIVRADRDGQQATEAEEKAKN